MGDSLSIVQNGQDDAWDSLIGSDQLVLDVVADQNLDPLFSGVFAANNLKPTRQTTLDSFFLNVKCGLIRVYVFNSKKFVRKD